MKIILLLLLVGFLPYPENSDQNKSVCFQSISLKEALAKAKAEHKNIFMDCYTSWCGPCKAIARDVFTVDSIADYFNRTFVCVKYDMEKEGKELTQKYPIDCYPTFLILDTAGNELHRLSGYYSAEKLMQAIRLARPENKLSQLEFRYTSGERSPEFIETYLIVLKGNGHFTHIDKLLDTLSLYHSDKDIDNPVLWRILKEFHNHTQTPDTRFFLTHIPQFKEKFGSPAVDELLDKLYSIEVTFYIFWEQKFPDQSFEIEKLNEFIDDLGQKEFAKQDMTMALALTEKLYREKEIDQAVHFLQTIKELRIFPQAHYQRIFSIYADRLSASTSRPETLKAIQEERDRILKNALW